MPPRKVTIKLLDRTLRRPQIKDILAMKVEVSGTVEDSKKRDIYNLLDRYDQKHGVTAMARTTAYPASILIQLIAQRAIEERGVIPLEMLGIKERIFNRIIDELEKRKVKIVQRLRYVM